MKYLLLPCLLLLSGTPALAQQPAQHTPRASHPRPAAAAATAAPAPAAAATGELAYYCASGNTVKYHSSATCKGLTRCSATVASLPVAEAQGKMQPCRICH